MNIFKFKKDNIEFEKGDLMTKKYFFFLRI